MTFVIGLTGGIGSGKTLVSDYFSELSVPIIDTDVIARKIVQPGEAALDALVARFGNGILLADGHLNRAELRSIAFRNDENKAALDAITHPAIRQETIKQVSSVTHSYCFVVVPLLNKTSPFMSFMQRILVVSAKRDTKIERIKIRSQLSKDEIERIMATQLDDTERLSFADDVVSNNKSKEQAYAQLDKLHSRYLELANDYICQKD